MSYLVLARKYRPQSFDEVVGQDHVTKTLSNAITHDRISHAYLFSGPRGTGKTSVARILAKCLNCDKGSSPAPCGQCSSCLEIARGQSLDVIEIDGASNRGIDEIRDLREKVRFIPTKSRYKVYIIDEVHMLTEPAFNALLKTLEEPPSHVIFIFATTEPYRIPPTILSRTQRFDFRRIPPSEITESLTKLTEHEKLEAEREALSFIGSCSEGSLRDAQGILDQVIAYSGGEIKLEDVFEVLGMLKRQELARLAMAIQRGDLKDGLDLIGEFIDRGVDLHQLIFGLTGFFRDILMITSLEEGGTLLNGLSKEEIEDLRKGAKGFKAVELIGIIEELSKLNQEMKRSAHPRLLLEVSLIKLVAKKDEPQINEIYKEIIALEGRLKGEAATDSLSSEFHHLEITPQLNVDEVRLAWPKVIKGLRQEKPTLASCLEGGELLEVQDSVILVGFKHDSAFQRDACEGKDAKELIRHKIKETLGQSLEIKTIFIEGGDSREHGVLYPEKERSDLDILQEMEPTVKKALEIFGGEIVRKQTTEAR